MSLTTKGWSTVRKKYKSTKYSKSKYKKRFPVFCSVKFDFTDYWAIYLLEKIQSDFENTGYFVSLTEIIKTILYEVLSGLRDQYPEPLPRKVIRKKEGGKAVICTQIPPRFAWVASCIEEICAAKKAAGADTPFMVELLKLAEVTLIEKMGGIIPSKTPKAPLKVDLSPSRIREILQNS